MSLVSNFHFLPLPTYLSFFYHHFLNIYLNISCIIILYRAHSTRLSFRFLSFFYFSSREEPFLVVTVCVKLRACYATYNDGCKPRGTNESSSHDRERLPRVELTRDATTSHYSIQGPSTRTAFPRSLHPSILATVWTNQIIRVYVCRTCKCWIFTVDES